MKQLLLDLTQNPDHSPTSYLPLSSHTEALAYLQNLQDAPAFAGLILQGNKDTGKTHLLNAWHSLNPNNAEGVDDIDTLSNKAQESLFHTYNRLKAENGKLVVTTTQPITDKSNILKDLRSRLLTLPVTILTQPSEADLTQLCLKWAKDLQMQLDRPLIKYLLTHTETTPTHLKNTLERLNAHSLEKKQKPTLPLLKITLNS